VFALVAYALWKRKIQWPAGTYLPWVLVMIAALIMTYSGMGLFTNNGIRFIASTRDDVWAFGVSSSLVVLGALAAGFPAKSAQLKWRNIPRHFLGGFLMGIASFMIPGGTEEWVAGLLCAMHMIFSQRRRPSQSAV
jgi:hypothetical protein